MQYLVAEEGVVVVEAVGGAGVGEEVDVVRLSAAE